MKMFNPPKKNKTAYFYYAKKQRSSLSKKNKDMTKKDINALIRKNWKELDDKTEWNTIADTDKKRFMEETELWNKYESERNVYTSITCKVNNIELGLCCLNNELRAQKPSIYPNRTCVLKTAKAKGLDYVQKLCIKNLEDVLKLIDWNKAHGISSYRLSSNMFPHATNKDFGVYSLDFCADLLKKIGDKVLEYGHRLSMHPGHFNHVGSPTESVFLNTIDDLEHHCDILERIEAGRDFKELRGILCIHGGGTYGDKEKSKKRWIENFKRLPENVKSRVCLENCEKSYSSEDCLEIAQAVGISHIFDVHHYNCYSILHPKEVQKPAEELIPRILKCWNDRGMKPYFHISEQGDGKVGKHSEFVEEIPKYMLDIDQDVTMDIEAKGKEKAVIYLAKKYS